MKFLLPPLCLLLFNKVLAQEEATAACKSALEACENDLECSNRLAPLMAACTTSTCQPQCRNAVLNVYQNKLGRALLRSDGTCIPGREELRLCNFMPMGNQVHCNVAKLVCEGDLQCNSKWGVFVSECEAESGRGECSSKCRGLLTAATSTPGGTAFQNCSCTEREDNLCVNLRDNVLGPCTKAAIPPIPDGTNDITESPAADASSAVTRFFCLLSLFAAIRLF